MTDPRRRDPRPDPRTGPRPDPRAERDRTLRRVRGTTAAAGVGAVVLTGALAGWLGHASAADTASSTAGSATTDAGPTGTDGTFTNPAEPPTADSSAGDDQPSLTTGGS